MAEEVAEEEEEEEEGEGTSTRHPRVTIHSMRSFNTLESINDARVTQDQIPADADPTPLTGGSHRKVI